MPERSPSLHETLVELNTQLEESGELEPGLREELRATADEIRAALEVSEDAAKELSPSLLDRLKEAVRRFEGSHPKLTAATGRVIDALSELGI